MLSFREAPRRGTAVFIHAIHLEIPPQLKKQLFDLVHDLASNVRVEVNIHHAKTHLSRLLERVLLGEEVVIAKAGKPHRKVGASPCPHQEENIGVSQGGIYRPRRFQRSVAQGDRGSFLAMKALLDTSRRAREIFVGPSDLWLSVASVWEIMIKVQTGRLLLPSPAGPYIVGKLAENRIEVLAVNLDHVLRVEDLPLHHRDPFDRILIAQSLEEHLPLITADPVFDRYPVQLIW